MLALIIASIFVGWFIVAVALALVIGRAVRIADRHERKRISNLERV